MKLSANGIGILDTMSLQADRTDEVSSTEYYFAWDTPGEMVDDAFVENADGEVLLCHMKQTSGVWVRRAAKATWANRAAVENVWVPWSKHHIVLGG